MTKIGFKRGGLKNFGMAKDRAKRASTDRKLTDVASTANQGAVVVRGGGKGKVPQKRGKDVNPEDEMAFVEERFTCLECLETSKRRGGVHDPCASNGSNRCRRHSHGADIENVSPSGEDREHLDAVEAFKQVRPGAPSASRENQPWDLSLHRGPSAAARASVVGGRVCG